MQLPNIVYTDGPQSDWGRYLIVGPSGGGKTHFCATFPSPFFVDSDKGLKTAASIHAPAMVIEPNTHASDVVMEIAKNFKKNVPPFSEMDAKTLIYDSLTSLSDLMEMELVRFPREQSAEAGKEVMSLPDFRVHRRRILNLVRYCQDLPMHVVFTANLKTDKDEITGSLWQVPSVAGAQLPTEITALFDEVYYLEYDDKTKEYVAHTKPFRYFRMAKSRLGLPDRIVDPSFTKVAGVKPAQ